MNSGFSMNDSRQTGASAKRRWIVVSLFVATAAIGGCGVGTSASDTRDIFTEDQGDARTGNQRRRPADAALRAWTINMNGCTGHLISPEYMMTAAHCRPSAGATYTSGAGQRGDISVESVAEMNGQLDYAILKIRWRSSKPVAQQFPPSVATRQSDVAVSSARGQGDEIFTVGFPGDKMQSWGATYSEGQLKGLRGDRLVYNMGIINGNSGGGVWRKRDNMLVSLTNAGPRMLGSAGWNQGDVDDPSDWNNGAAMWMVYERSSILKDIFPNGRNRFASDSTVVPPGSVKLPLLLGAVDALTGSFPVTISAPPRTTQVVVCPNLAVGDSCTAASPNALSTSSRQALAGGRLAFVTTQPISPNSSLQLAIVATDAAGQVLESRTVRMAAR